MTGTLTGPVAGVDITVRETIYLFGAIFAFLVVVMSPYYLIDFVHYDDLNLFDPHFWAKSPADEIRSGRFLFDRILHSTLFPIVQAYHSLGVLPYIRLANSLLLAAAATLFAVHLRGLGLSRLVSFGTSALIIVLPGAQQQVEHAMEFVMAVANVFGLAGGILLTRCGARLLHPRSMSLADWLLLSGSVLMLLLSCNTYQGAAMFFLLPILSTFLFRPGEIWPRLVLAGAQISIFCTGLFIYFLSNKFVFIPLGARWLPAVGGPADGVYHFDVTSAFVQRAFLALRVLLPAAAQLWWFQFDGAGYLIILLAALFTMGLALRQNRGAESYAAPTIHIEPFLALGVLFVTAVLANVPAIMSEGGWLFFRLLFPCSALFVLFLVWIGAELWRGARREFHVALVILLAIVGISAHVTVQASASNANAEVTLLRAAIGQFIQSTDRVKELFIIRPPNSPTYAGPPAYGDEFNAPSTRDRGFTYAMVKVLSQTAKTSWSDIFESQLRPTFEPAYFADDVTDSANPSIQTTACKSDLQYVHEGAAIANMAAPLYLGPTFMEDNPRSCVGELAYYDGSPEAFPDHYSLRLFENDKTPDSFWETTPYPVIFFVRYAASKIVDGYELGAPDNSMRMPISWLFEGSVDNFNWVTLDQQQDQTDWSPGQEKHFSILQPDAYKYYRLVFTKGRDKILRIGGIALDATNIRRPTTWSVSYLGEDGQPIVQDITPPQGSAYFEARVKGQISILMQFAGCRTSTKYRFRVGPFGKDSTDRQPAEWAISVRSAKGAWIPAGQERMNDTLGNDRWYNFALHSGRECVHEVRWDILKASNSDVFRLYAFQLIDHSVDSGPLYTYKNYDVVRVGDQYVAAAHELGPIDVRKVLANTAPRPPVGKFFTADDTVSLNAMINLAVDGNDALRLLYAYRNYNIIRVGEIFVGVAQDLGKIELRPILMGQAARPPAARFIVAGDPANLENTIDAYIRSVAFAP